MKQEERDERDLFEDHLTCDSASVAATPDGWDVADVKMWRDIRTLSTGRRVVLSHVGVSVCSPPA